MVKIAGLNARALVKNFRKGYLALKKRQEEGMQMGGMGQGGGAGGNVYQGPFIFPGGQGMPGQPKKEEDKK